MIIRYFSSFLYCLNCYVVLLFIVECLHVAEPAQTTSEPPPRSPDRVGTHESERAPYGSKTPI